MAHTRLNRPVFFRQQNPHERMVKLNEVATLAEETAERVDQLEESGLPGGSGPTDPGDLTVYYENGKA